MYIRTATASPADFLVTIVSHLLVSYVSCLVPALVNVFVLHVYAAVYVCALCCSICFYCRRVCPVLIYCFVHFPVMSYVRCVLLSAYFIVCLPLSVNPFQLCVIVDSKSPILF